jgi:polyhydroxyalkanoate synthesis repressor PhaR
VETGPERQVRVIKRYANRKLYDATESRYVTLQDVEALVQSGVGVRVVDNRSGEDVTQTTLAQILCDAGRRRDPRYPLDNLLSLFRNPDLEEKVRDFARRATERRDTAEQTLREMWAAPQRALEDLQRKLDERIALLLRDFAPLRKLETEVRKLEADVRELSERVAALESRLPGPSARKPVPPPSR